MIIQKVLSLLQNSDIRAQVDDRNEKTGKKIRDAELKRIPYMLILGEKEENSSSVSARKQGEGDLGSMSVDEFVKIIKNEIENLLKF